LSRTNKDAADRVPLLQHICPESLVCATEVRTAFTAAAGSHCPFKLRCVHIPLSHCESFRNGVSPGLQVRWTSQRGRFWGGEGKAVTGQSRLLHPLLSFVPWNVHNNFDAN
jgi:hypothetical protein